MVATSLANGAASSPVRAEELGASGGIAGVWRTQAAIPPRSRCPQPGGGLETGDTAQARSGS